MNCKHSFSGNMDAANSASQFRKKKTKKPAGELNKTNKKLIDSSLLDYYRNINNQLAEGFSDESHKGRPMPRSFS